MAIKTIFLIVTFFLVSLFTVFTWAKKDMAFEDWLEEIRRQALVRGISGETLDGALNGLKPIPRVIELDRNQPEFDMTLDEYLHLTVTDKRITKGKIMLAKHRALLADIFDRYGVPPRYIVALWALESDFGRRTSSFPVIGALATLAYEGRRRSMFQKELFYALRILDDGSISKQMLKGSWAGAMGQLQFMPSTFYRFAVDYDGNGQADIWNSLKDAFASAANYLSKSGWKTGRKWGREVCLPKGFDRALLGLKTHKHLSEWQSLGVRGPKGYDLPKEPDLYASLIQPDTPKGRAFLVYDNYRVILDWNRSHLFGIAVGILADNIEEH